MKQSEGFWKSIDDRIDDIQAEARLNQGLEAMGGTRDKKMTGKFIVWVCNDVEKECQGEMASSGLTWTQVQSALSSKARAWFLN